MTAQPQKDWREQEYSSEQYKTLYKVAGVVILVLGGVLIGAALFAGDNPLVKDTGYWTNLFTEVISVAATFGLIGLYSKHRHRQQWKERLVHEAGSRSNERAKNAIDDLRWKGWLAGDSGLLQGVNLRHANLEGAGLRYANLQGADLGRTNLEGAGLSYANLQGAKLSAANLQHAGLYYTNLQGANLQGAVLQGAQLWGTVLQGAKLWDANLRDADLQTTVLQGAGLSNANLQGANLRGAVLPGAQLPDGTKWTPETDMARFTDPTHPDFWDPDVESKEPPWLR